ncbi:MAG: Na(+)/H(+) antiporter subunit D [Gammaproteobacteria bacterium]|nr:Na(+)/H(+) antiporter subunit D [Gammaproteobacteria bacterium]
MTPTELPPFLIFYLAAFALLLSRGWLRHAVLLLTPLVGFLNLLGTVHGMHWQITIFDYGLTPYRVDSLSLFFGYLFHLAAFIGIIYALHVRDTMQQVAALLYAGSALGAVFAGDLISLFVFWELLAVTSVFLIWARRTPQALAAGMRYLIIQITSGVLLLGGALFQVHHTGSIAFDYIGLTGVGSWLIFIAFGIKCAFPFVHNWLTDAYPEATPTGTVFLSAFTTKVAVYALARGFAGTEILVFIGALMTCFPIFYAVIENDLRRVLAYSMINQLGFMVCGIGIGTELALNGAISHAFNDVIFKGLLMMAMGAVLYRTGKINGSELGGLYKSMPKTTAFCLVGAASISAFPLFSGFVSKSMVMVAALEQGHDWIWLALLFASAGVFHHAGIKIPFFAFYAHDSGIRVKEAPTNMLIAMGLSALLCILVGAYPWALYRLLPFPLDYTPFDASHIIAQLQLLFFSALAFVWLKLSNIYPPELPSTNIDAEWIYRRFAPSLVRILTFAIHTIDSKVRNAAITLTQKLTRIIYQFHGPEGILARTWTTGSVALIAMVLFALILSITVWL